MKPIEFKKALESITTKKQLDPRKAAKLSTMLRESMTKHLIKLRQPVVTCLLPDDLLLQEPWLNAMGYMYKSVSSTTGLTFRHTCEHVIY